MRIEPKKIFVAAVTNGAPLRTLALAAVALAAACTAGAAEPSAGADIATVELYASMNAKDLPGVMRHVASSGFSEIDAGASASRRLDERDFKALFASSLTVALGAADLQVQSFGDVAVVTGVRTGGVGPAGAAPASQRLPMTLVWQREGDRWLLRHVHLSPQPRKEGE